MNHNYSPRLPGRRTGRPFAARTGIRCHGAERRKGRKIMPHVNLTDLIEKMKLENLTPEIQVKGIRITQPDINRPALQLAGYFEHHEPTRLQIIGFVEYSYMEAMPEERKLEIYNQFFSYAMPCVVYCRELQPDPLFRQIAIEKKVPILMTKKATSAFMAEAIRWLNVRLAPCISVHGVLVDVYGEGVLITGESGIGKSEAALELIKRGHRLVSDDVVEIRKVSDDTLIGSAPDITKHFIELRGIGIIDVKTLFGVSSVKDTQSIDLVIRLEDWNKDKEYDRLGLEEEYTEYLGNKVVCHSIPDPPRTESGDHLRIRGSQPPPEEDGIQRGAGALYARAEFPGEKKRGRRGGSMRYCFGVDVGGTTVKLGFFDEEGKLLEKWEIPTRTQDSGKHILPDVAASILDKMKEREVSRRGYRGRGDRRAGPCGCERNGLCGREPGMGDLQPEK